MNLTFRMLLFILYQRGINRFREMLTVHILVKMYVE